MWLYLVFGDLLHQQVNVEQLAILFGRMRSFVYGFFFMSDYRSSGPCTRAASVRTIFTCSLCIST